MALRVKWSYAEEILRSLREGYIGRDLQLDPREVILKLDAIVNEQAKAGFLENWKLYHSAAIGDQFITEFSPLTVTDPVNKMPSYVQIPAHYAELVDNRGIDQVFFINDFSTVKTKYFSPLIITSFKDVSSYRDTVGEYLEGRISCYPKGGYLFFDRGNINSKYGPIGMRLVVRDSGAISDDAPYPIPAEKENFIMNQAIEFFRIRLAQPKDEIKDATDAIKQ